MLIIRKFWSDHNDTDESSLVVINQDEGTYHSMPEEEALLVLREALEIVAQLHPLLSSKGIKFYTSDN